MHMNQKNERQSFDCLKRKIVTCYVNITRDDTFFTHSGWLFLVVGPLSGKEQSPYLAEDHGTCSRVFEVISEFLFQLSAARGHLNRRQEFLLMRFIIVFFLHWIGI